ncbi:hypothetical protein M433DRAFT_157158 [Acidomyces richmondensis BFW]|nr:MAG: hypothetical protein FE78DRAFT_89770 [Acidomyces sp. 'richmondensis']KYG43073.1 hypothetical protein M433DRAFT_157158 [Acidomyces richmondensis BFW]
MNNVWWVSIAFRAPCARQTRAKPLLHLFTGYTRYANQHHPSLRLGGIRRCQLYEKRAFTTSSLLEAKHKTSKSHSPKSKSQSGKANVPDSILKPAPTVASHLEGIPAKSTVDEEPLTWRDYDPEGGMPLPGEEPSKSELKQVFGDHVDEEQGLYILNVMYWRRMSGALIDSGLEFPKNSGVTREMALSGLNYIRTLDPDFDEEAAGQQWVREESIRLQNEIRERSIRLGLYKDMPEEEGAETTEEESEQGTAYGRERYKDSQLAKIRDEYKAKWEREQAEEEARKERKERAAMHSQRGPLELQGGVQPVVAITSSGPGGVAIGTSPKSGWLPATVERKPWVKYYEEQAQTIKDNILPQISVFGRLAPSLIVTLAVVALGIFVSDNYTPPPKSARIWPDTPPAAATLTAISAVLVSAFFVARLPPAWKALNKYYTIVPAKPYAVSVVGAIFRHDTVAHLVTNLASLWIFGLLLHDDVGRGTFLAIFLASGAVGGFTSLTYNVLRKQWTTYISGSSGSILGMAAAACTLHPTRKIRVLGYEIPIAAWMLLALFGGLEAVAALRGMRTMIDHAGHLGGIIAGMGAGFYLKSEIKSTRSSMLSNNADTMNVEASSHLD